MQDRMLDAADILIDRHPVIDGGPYQRLIGRRGAAKPRKIPGAVDEGVAGVGLTACGLAAARAIHVFPRGVMVERVARPIERHVVRQAYRQLVIGYRHDPAIIAMNDWNGAT